MRIIGYKDIDREEWNALVKASATGTWFQTPEAFDFFNAQKELFKPFAIAIEKSESRVESREPRELRGVCVGYVTVEKSAFKQFLTRRAIIIGGPCLADDCINEEVIALLEAVKTKTRNLQSSDDNLPSLEQQSARKQASGQTIAQSCAAGAESQQDSSQKHASLTKNSKNIFHRYAPIYIETRNFNDYSRWQDAFAAAGFDYKPHLNFHVDTSSVEGVEANLGKSRKRDIRTTIREGVTIKSIYDLRFQISDLERERLVREYYAILEKLYKTKVKTPLFPVEFFLELSKHKDARFLLTELNGKIIGGTVCVEQANKCVYEWFVCGEDGVYPHVFPSSYATYAGIKYASEHGCARFDMMGAGTPDEEYGVRDFKARFGGELVEHGRFLCVTKPLLYKIGVLGVKLLKKLK